MNSNPPKLLILGAHPDDAEFHAGGLSLEYRQRDWPVKWVSVTDGSSGHHQLDGATLRDRRRQELFASAAKIGATAEVWGFQDGQLLPDLSLREAVIRELRQFQPDLVLTHRPWDYHPDHRAVGGAIQDACYLVTVPLVLPDVPALRRDPVVASMVDLFQRPVPLRPDFLLDGSHHLDQLVEMLACHESQVFEFLPYSFHLEEPVPVEPAPRRAWLKRWLVSVSQRRWQVLSKQGTAGLSSPEWIEAFEISEYAAQLPLERLEALFPGCLRVTHRND